MTTRLPTVRLAEMLEDARARTLALVEGLSAEQLIGPCLDTVNPLLWEIGHVAWFHEHFALRTLGDTTPLLDGGDALYDSSKVPHDDRWHLKLPSLHGTLDYMRRVHERMIGRLGDGLAGAAESYLYQLTTFHEDMHDEAFTYSRQTLGYPAPRFGGDGEAGFGPHPGDAEVPGGRFVLGPAADAGFIFDNEKWPHEIALAPFRIARAPVTNAEYAEFVGAGGYRNRAFWDDEGWAWRKAAGAEHPVYWVPEGSGRWQGRRFDRIEPLAPHQPVVHVSWHEASAWCRWAGRRLPTEFEWEAAAVAEPGGGKRRFPWGDAPPATSRANLDGAALGSVDVAAHPDGDSAFGCRQMIGNVWEWTASPFLPYPGFAPDIYTDYSAPWFGTRKVLRGGAWATRARMITPAYRNFFTPGRRDILAGFRTAAL